jgi:Asp-tRNA(Asn)/Glu-tRNA(Gln) amidotransferase A subunit family amidase
MSATVSDCILAFSVLSQRKVRRRDIRKIRIGSLVDMPELSEFSQLGAKTVGITPIPAPRFDFSKVYRAQAAITHRRWFPSRSSEYGPDAQAKLHYARRALAVDYYDGLLELRRWRTMINRSDPPDIIIAPTLGSAIPPADVSEPTIRDELGRYTRIFSYLDWPAVAIGPLQLAGPDEDTVLSAALELERSRSALGRPAESSAPRPRDTARGHLGGRGHG